MNNFQTTYRLLLFLFIVGCTQFAFAADRPFPQAQNLAASQMNAAVSNYWFYWKSNYLAPSAKVPGDYKVKFDRQGTTVSEAMGYGMLLAVYFAGADSEAKKYFDGLNHFRKRFPSSINPALMCWKIPAKENAVRDDGATDGDLDMALALLLAHEQWREETYLAEATNYINAIAAALVRNDFSLRLGDWNSVAGQTRPSDFMPATFRAFYAATQDGRWTNVEAKCYAILEALQTNSAPVTGLIPDFAVIREGRWQPATPKFLEGPHDGEFNYNACRVPWRIGWAAASNSDKAARQILQRFMTWVAAHHAAPADFRAGYRLDGTSPSGNNFEAACFVSPTGVAALAVGDRHWLDATIAYAVKKKESYYEDSVNLLSLLVMSGNAWLPAGR